jgi:hypothetical protein
VGFFAHQSDRAPSSVTWNVTTQGLHQASAVRGVRDAASSRSGLSSSSARPSRSSSEVRSLFSFGEN